MEAGGSWDVWFSVPPRGLWWSTLSDEWPDLLAVFVFALACFLWALRPQGLDRERVAAKGIRRTKPGPQRLALNAQLSGARAVPTAAAKTQPSSRGSDQEEEQTVLPEARVAARVCAKDHETRSSLLDSPRYLEQLNTRRGQDCTPVRVSPTGLLRKSQSSSLQQAGCAKKMKPSPAPLPVMDGETDTAARSSDISANMQLCRSHSATDLQATQARIQKECMARRAFEAPMTAMPYSPAPAGPVRYADSQGHAEHEGPRPPTIKALLRSNERERERERELRRAVSEENLGHVTQLEQQPMSPGHELDSSNLRQRRLPRSHSDEAIMDNTQRSCFASSLCSLSSSSCSSPARPSTRQEVAAAGSHMRRQGAEMDAVTAHLSAELGRLKQEPASVQTLQQQVAVLTRLLQQHDKDTALLASTEPSHGSLPKSRSDVSVARSPSGDSPSTSSRLTPGSPGSASFKVQRSPSSGALFFCGDSPSTSSRLTPGSSGSASFKVQRSPSSGALFYSHIVNANFLAGLF